MAGYNSGNRGGYNNQKPSYAGTPARTKDENVVLSTGLFKSEEGKKSIASVQVKEDVMIPAGSYINLYKGENSKHPNITYLVQVRKYTKKA